MREQRRLVLTNLYLPITSQPRELDSKLLLALFACERGIKPFIGYKTVFPTRIVPFKPGYVLVHNARQNAAHLDRLKSAGHQVIVLDEEALVRQSDEIFLRKHSQHAFDRVHHVLCWGDDDRDMWAASDFDPACGLTVVGNPRMDLLRPELSGYYSRKVAELREIHGDYVLLNTNFPTVNNLTPQGRGLRLAEWARDDRGLEVESAFLANKREMFSAMVELVPELAKAIAPVNLVVRPHPNEDHSAWIRAAEGIPNARVVFEGSVVPWLLGARALIHNNCTTAVEAAVAGTPVLNYRPWKSEHDNPISHAGGLDCGDAGAIAVAVSALMEGTKLDLSPEQRELLRRHVANVDGTFACERIADLLVDPHGRVAMPLRATAFSRARTVISHSRLWVQRATRLLVSKAGRRKLHALRARYPDFSILSLDFARLSYSEEQFDLLMRQFPPLDVEDVNARIADMARALGRFAGMQAIMCPGGILTIRRDVDG